MAGGSKSKSKVREWMRRRMAPRRKQPAAAATATGNSSESASAQSSPRRKLLAAAVPSAQRWRNVVAAVFQRAVYHLLWLVESVVVVAQLCFFFLRFGFRL
ncbi:hypothetical protein BDA96_03G249300 [Sorghum bicolor]|uniref:Uncharacterized protein n=2 Tax=Sorghum bicolor TaxID=4558 RepID=C5XEG5_SORBI|nr:uncharacterized protein LOC8058197 [Sorghum bicolor]EES01130.1 hypothetical protein SORBI_3003G230100 [Sorghum bicolor]KAG0538587.1 hypothetical protein BDA96_03G249300 [Sorghum bicolor]|eukprot:XP_002456010.1 uncharacterized protein LOC8058197 [Sorghum bicolor]